ncbi:hypothetical protein GCM10007242_45670 [Pigmentiphaga litoralis]|nr:hypothetical protein GCM10007242_45670 [Pigmentiphaga litoralis]
MLFQQNPSLQWTAVPYSGSGPAVTDMLGGHVDGLFAPAGTPQDIIDTLSEALAAMMKDPQQVRLITEMGFEPVGSTPAALAEEIRISLPKWKQVAARGMPAP